MAYTSEQVWTAAAVANRINGEYVKGHVPPEADRFKTVYAAEFKKEQFRRLNGATEPAEIKDSADAGEFHDAE